MMMMMMIMVNKYQVCKRLLVILIAVTFRFDWLRTGTGGGLL
jgi:hypothetical protein